jgi:ABC-type bacteriocin/lantibiotic exporter with double-glycine peptidase domain
MSPILPNKIRPIQQMEAAECGVACLAMLLDYHGASIPLDELRDHCGTSRDGNSALQLLQAAKKLGMVGRGMKLTLEQLAAARTPLILHWNMNHFVVFERFSRGHAVLIDPASGRIQADLQQLSQCFSGVALQVAPGPNFMKRARKSESIRRYWSNLSQRKRALAFVMLAGACSELLGVVSPAISQLLIDEVIRPLRQEWLLPVLSVLLLSTATSLVLGWLFQIALSRLQTVLRSTLTDQLGRRLLRLPLEFVGGRSRSDLLQRVYSHAGLGDLLTKTALGLFQALFALALAALMLAYDPMLGGLALGIDLLRLVVLRVAREDARQRSAGELSARAHESAVVMQATSCAEAVKSFGMERRLEEWYERRLTERLSWTRKVARLSSGAGSWLGIFDGVARAMVFLIGGTKVIHFEMSIGVFAGFLAIRSLLGGPLASIWHTLEGWLEFRSVLARSDDLLAQQPISHGQHSAENLRGQITLRNVGFRYSSGSPWIVRGVSLTIEPGQHVAFVGPSGQGKSTLLSIAAGILSPTEGEVLLDGVEIRQCSEESLARAFGTVVGTPLVTAGTVRENLVLRLPESNDAAVLDAAQAACFAEVVARLPRGYETELEPEGANLSGGERQRLGIAQALLGRPRVLFLDEATCFLDAETESRVIANFLRAGVTVVSVAHRPRVIEASQQVFRIESGQVVRVETSTSAARLPSSAVAKGALSLGKADTVQPVQPRSGLSSPSGGSAPSRSSRPRSVASPA